MKASALEAVNHVAASLGTSLASPPGGEFNLGKCLNPRPIHGTIAGSAAMVAYHQLAWLEDDTDNPWIYSYGDVDVFLHNPGGDTSHMVRAEERLLNAGFTYLNDRQEVALRRIDVQGQPKWQTISIRMKSPQDVEVNLISKRVNGNYMLSPIDVLQSFDWAWLTVAAWNTATGGFVSLERTLRDYHKSIDMQFSVLTPRFEDFKEGIMSQFLMLRQMPRLAKYMIRIAKAHNHAYNTNAWGDEYALFERLRHSAAKAADILVQAYEKYAAFHWDRTSDQSMVLGDVAAAFAAAAKKGEWQKIIDLAAKYGVKDQLDRLVDELT